MNSRRSFVLGAGGAAVSLMAGKASANSRVRVAVLGINGRGTGPYQRVQRRCPTPRW